MVGAYMHHIRTHATNVTRKALHALLGGDTTRVCHFSDAMDNGTVLHIRIQFFLPLHSEYARWSTFQL